MTGTMQRLKARLAQMVSEKEQAWADLNARLGAIQVLEVVIAEEDAAQAAEAAAAARPKSKKR